MRSPSSSSFFLHDRTQRMEEDEEANLAKDNEVDEEWERKRNLLPFLSFAFLNERIKRRRRRSRRCKRSDRCVVASVVLDR